MYAPETATPPAEGYQVLTFPRRKPGRELRAEGTRMDCPHCEFGSEVCDSEMPRTACPHCGADCEIRTSEGMTITMRETTYRCTNPECGHTFVARLEIVRTLSPSATPNPSVSLPISSHVRRDVLRAVLEHAEEAPHKSRYTKPVTGDLFMGGPDTG